jgi:hypothetical protein
MYVGCKALVKVYYSNVKEMLKLAAFFSAMGPINHVQEIMLTEHFVQMVHFKFSLSSCSSHFPVSF